MPAEPAPKPTLWRTCRVLANRNRLKILKLLFAQPNQAVSAVAEQLNLSLPVASQSLRALEARGILIVRRTGRTVKYHPGSGSPGDTEAARELIPALRLAFRQNSDPIEPLFKLATAFTHARRVEIFRVLRNGARTVAQLNHATGIPSWALLRHLRKLEARGFVTPREGAYVTTTSRSTFGRALARQALR